MMDSDDRRGQRWTLLTGHGRVLVEIARDRGARIRDISARVGLTEHTVQAIVTELETAGYITRTRTGRRTRYAIDPDRPFRHRAQAGLRIGPMLSLLTAMTDAETHRRARPPAAPGAAARDPAPGDRLGTSPS